MHIQEGPGEISKPALLPEQKAIVLRELELILDSTHFRGSKRCQQFLRYSVEHALAGDLDQLKERSIGIALFGREATYDTGEDAIVRVAAKGMRNRLLQYYAGLTTEPPCRLELPPGSYIPEFQWPDSAIPAEAVASPERRLHLSRAVLAAGSVASTVLIALAVFFLARSAPDPTARFWGPALDSSRRVLICLASPAVYRLEDTVYRRFGAVDPPGLRPAPIPDDGIVQGHELVPFQNDYIAVGDALAATRLTALLTRLDKTVQVRATAEVSFTDLRTAPTILIGAFSNTWTMEMMKEWRFFFDIPSGWVIRDRTNPSRTWEDSANRGQLRGRKTTEDYGLITRVLHPSSGQPLVAVAGIDAFGTSAAAEFLSDDSLLATALEGAPRGWENKNVQIVIKTSVAGRTAGVPQFVARQIW